MEKVDEEVEVESVESVESCRTLSLQLLELCEEIKTSSPHLMTHTRPHVRTHLIEALTTEGLGSVRRLHCPCPRALSSRVGACREAVRRAGLQGLQGKLREAQNGGLE